jgi:hypothetical protein
MVQVRSTENRRLSYLRLCVGGLRPRALMDSRTRWPQQHDDLFRVGSQTRCQARRAALLCHPWPLPPPSEGLERVLHLSKDSNISHFIFHAYLSSISSCLLRSQVDLGRLVPGSPRRYGPSWWPVRPWDDGCPAWRCVAAPHGHAPWGGLCLATGPRRPGRHGSGGHAKTDHRVG